MLVLLIEVLHGFCGRGRSDESRMFFKIFSDLMRLTSTVVMNERRECSLILHHSGGQFNLKLENPLFLFVGSENFCTLAMTLYRQNVYIDVTFVCEVYF